MSQTLKVAFALLFVAVLGWVLLQPVFDAVDVEPTEAQDDFEPAETPGPTRAPGTASPESSDHEPDPLPEEFRSEPLLEPFPADCLKPAPALSDAIAVDSGDAVAAGELGSTLQEFPAKALVGVSVNGRVVWKEPDAGLALANLNVDAIRPLSYARDFLWSPVSPCGLVIAKQSAGVSLLPSRRPLIRADVRDAAFSADGGKLAVVVNGDRASTVWIAALSRNRLREVVREQSGTRIRLRGWSPDNETLFYTGPAGGLAFVTTSDPPQSGRVTSDPVENLEHCGGRLLAIHQGAIVAIDTTGPDALTTRQDGYRYISCSPDGSFIAAIGREGLVLLDREGTFLRDLTQDSGYTDVFVDWGARGRGLIFGRVRSEGSPVAAELWHIREGGTPAPTGINYRGGPRAVDWAASPPTGLP